MAGIDLGDAWADEVWEEGVWADGVWEGQEEVGAGGGGSSSLLSRILSILGITDITTID